MERLDLLARLAQPATTRIVLLILDGVGDIRTADQPRTPLEAASTPNLDALAAKGTLGRLIPVAQGITPGSGPGHLALFGYDPLSPEADIGRGVLEALGLGMEVRPGDVVARGNFATADSQGRLMDRRAGRPPTEETRRLCQKLQRALAQRPVPGVEIIVHPGEGHRFVLLLRGEGLSSDVADTDPQATGVPPLEPRALNSRAEGTVRYLRQVLAILQAALSEEPQANRLLLRGFSTLPRLPQMPELYRLRCGAFAGYPLYRGVAAACGMEVVPCGKGIDEVLAMVPQHWERFDFFFLHVKGADLAGEDGDRREKIRTLEAVDAALPQLLALEPEVVAVTGDHSTPVALKAHSWHPVPLLLYSHRCFVDDCREFSEAAAIHGALGTLKAQELMGVLLAHAGRLAKYGA